MRIAELIKTLKGIQKVSGNLEIGIRNDEKDQFVPLDGFSFASLDRYRDFCSVSNLTGETEVILLAFKLEE